jgi:RIO kinase 1
MESLNALVADGVVDEVLGQLKAGKEAEVWLVRHQGQVLAAKVYKERHHRNFRNNADYKEGRLVRKTRTQRAMSRGSRFGKRAADDAWKAAESDALRTLHAAGVRVPKPVLFYEGVLLMEVVVDAAGHAAPRLVDAPVSLENARPLYEAVRANVVKMLCADLVHGDLSEFNVLLGWDGPVLIDFPQVVVAARNSRAEHFLRRDLENLRRFFGSFDPAIASRHGDAEEIWRAYVRRELCADFAPTGRLVRPHRVLETPRSVARAQPGQPSRRFDGPAVVTRGVPERGPRDAQSPPASRRGGRRRRKRHF